jgi:hypothetical protein
MVAEKKNRPDGEEWTTLGTRQNAIASLVCALAYGAPWLLFLMGWPPFASPPFERRPPLGWTLGMGIGWYAAIVLLLVVLVPGVLARAGRGDLAWSWRGAAIKGALIYLPVAAIGTGMLLPLSLGVRVIAAGVLFAVELLAVLWLKRKLWDASCSRDA